MTQQNKELRNLFHRIGGTLLMFLALYNLLCGSSAQLMAFLTEVFPRSASVYIVTDLICSLSYVASFTFPAVFFYLISKGKKVEPMGLSLHLSKKNTALSTLAIIFLGTSVCLSCSYVNSILFTMPESAYDSIASSKFDHAYQLILMFISTAIVPAFVEELLFRGVILSNIRPYNESGAVVISAVLFGLMHQTPFQLFYATAVGIVLGIVYLKTGTIWSGILLHFFNNLFSVLQTYILDVYDSRTGNMIYNIMICTVIGLGILLGTLLLIVDRRTQNVKSANELGIYRKREEMYCDDSKKVDFRTVLRASLSPVLLIFVVLCVLLIAFMAIALGQM